MPITLNHNNVVLDGHHRLKACRELGIPAICSVKDFTNRPIDELEFVVSVNLHRKHLDLNEFQRAEIGLKMEKPAREIAAKRNQASQFTRESGKKATMKRFYGPRDSDDIASEIPPTSADTSHISLD